MRSARASRSFISAAPRRVGRSSPLYLRTSPGARAYYDQRRAAAYEHHEALRALGNRWISILHGCLKHRTPYDEHTAWAHRHATAA